MERNIIQLDWDGTLSKVNGGTELSMAIGWGFTGQDLLVLTCLHEAGLHRQKIEDLLEDCNFHAENGFLREGNYEECREFIFKEDMGYPWLITQEESEEESKAKTPCDYLKDEDGWSVCPYENDGVSESERCRVCCGVGVDEDEPEREE